MSIETELFTVHIRTVYSERRDVNSRLVYCRRQNPESRNEWRRIASYVDCHTRAECELRYARLCPEEVHWRGNLFDYRWSPDEDMVCL